ncbi:MAG: ATP-binding protein [Acidobacteria bacterium]|nr:ATP-binding protein [Acidobacteriota bacterium]
MRNPFVSAPDLVWLLFFAALAAASPFHDVPSVSCIIALALLQVAEPRVAVFQTERGKLLPIAIKLILCWLVIGYTASINSSYYPILMLPVVSAATTTGPLATAVVTALACVAYMSFLLFVDWSDLGRYLVEWEELLLRIIFLPLVGYLTYQLARANRAEAQRYQAAAEDLARANQSLVAAEDAVRRSERLAALGQLTAGLAHELRNPIGTIRASAEMLQKQLPAGNEMAQEMAGFITTEVDRASSLIGRFLEFARPVALHRVPTELHAVLDRAVQQFERMSPAPTATVYKNYDPAIRPVPLDGEWMERVIYNLVVNAAQASPAGAIVTLRTRLVDDAVEIAVIDRGEGIAPEHRESIFNPFFTTKRDGVGLGLPIVAKIVSEHGGRIDLESEAGKGSIFRVLLPVSLGE